MDNIRVVNVSVKHIRKSDPQYHNLKQWIEDPRNLYVARGGVVFIDGARYPQLNSPYCNRYKIGRDGDRDEVLTKYGKWLDMRPDLIEKCAQDLIGVECVGCWCAPEPCHADILLAKVRAWIAARG
jgi:hypothetical protein